jgi:FKBP-type peptidyl-prolyl cis-trans isomerase SlyD
MNIAPNKVVLVHYTLTENDATGAHIETTTGGEPLGFIYGVGMMIPAFEENLAALKTGDPFSFGIAAANAYGEHDEQAVVELPKNIFEENGKIPDGLLEVGRILPFNDPEGYEMEGKLTWIGLDKVKVDFNHPMAGKDLFFTGHVELVRDAEPAELEHGHVHGHGGMHH